MAALGTEKSANATTDFLLIVEGVFSDRPPTWPGYLCAVFRR
jgi:hypothetical protein